MDPVLLVLAMAEAVVVVAFLLLSLPVDDKAVGITAVSLRLFRLEEDKDAEVMVLLSR